MGASSRLPKRSCQISDNRDNRIDVTMAVKWISSIRDVEDVAAIDLEGGSV